MLLLGRVILIFQIQYICSQCRKWPAYVVTCSKHNDVKATADLPRYMPREFKMYGKQSRYIVVNASLQDPAEIFFNYTVPFHITVIIRRVYVDTL